MSPPKADATVFTVTISWASWWRANGTDMTQNLKYGQEGQMINLSSRDSDKGRRCLLKKAHPCGLVRISANCIISYKAQA